MATLEQAIRQMREAGMPDFPPGHPRTNTDRIVRYGGAAKKAWYRLYEYQARNGKFYVSGAFGMWGEIEGTKVATDWTGMAQEEMERLKRSQQEQEKAEKDKREQRARFAGNRARAQWHDARSAKPSVETYLDRKGVLPEKGVRWFADGTLLVPMLRYDVTEDQEQDPAYTGPRRLVGLQKIAPDGTKRFNKGMAPQAAACRLGPAPRRGELILVTEGIATGLTLRMAIESKHPVYVVFSAGNLVPAGQVLRKLFPASPILFCADDDAYLVSSMNKLLRENFGLAETVAPPLTDAPGMGRAGELRVSAEYSEDENGVQGVFGSVRQGERVYTFTRQNAGRVESHKAAAAAGNATVIHPAFADRKLSPDPDVAGKLTDFNDLHKAEGLEAVRAQLKAEMERFALSEQVRRMVEQQLGKPKEKKEKKPVATAGLFEYLLKRYTLIYPSDTLWDEEVREIVKFAHTRLRWSDGVMKWWAETPRRRVVNIDQLVFEPGEKTPADCINLFRGMALKPSADASCDRLIALLRFICSEEELHTTPVSDWVLKWLAYPLQHQGAKMKTAIVMHGPEGAGKNLFFGAIHDIYGEYATLITQTELEDKFNGWMSRRLFLIANEVISRQELRHHVGRLKNMVDPGPGNKLPIRDMWAPIRYETNHANMVFLTNELHALQIMPGDRRYMVIRTPPPAAARYYSEAAAEVAAGGIAALYAHLLKVDCTGFDQHTKPLMTEAKEALIQLGLSSTQMFQQQLHDGLLWPLAYGPCLSTDLYRAYLIWCSRTGERNPARIEQFSQGFMAMNGVTRRVMDIDDAIATTAGVRRKQGTVFQMGDLPDDVRGDDGRSKAFIKQKIAEFLGNLKDYADQDQLRRSGRKYGDERDG